MKNSPLDWSINLLLFVVMEFMPQECAVQVWGLEFMEGEGGRRWQVRGIAFKLIDDKISILTTGKGNRPESVLLFLISMLWEGAVWGRGVCNL
jgi:hypothetical protein